MKMHPVARKWCSQIDKNSPAGPRTDRKTLLGSVLLSRVWKRIIRKIGKTSIRNVLEVGSGTGSQIIPLAWRGYSAVGVDCSYRALNLCRRIVEAIEKETGKELAVSLVCSDFFDLAIDDRFSLVFHRGVSEHYLDREDRLRFVRKMFEYVSDDGYVVSIVPSGIHPWRSRYREGNLGGYNIPEIDYSPELLREEAIACGGKDVIVLPHNIMGYLKFIPAGWPTRFIRGLIYLFFQLVPPVLLSESFKNRHAYSLVCIASGRKG